VQHPGEEFVLSAHVAFRPLDDAFNFSGDGMLDVAGADADHPSHVHRGSQA
jgi:hypothetical protein